MATHESSVNYENLIRDLADMYPFDVGTVILVELIANSLDSKADTIQIDFDPKSRILVVTDNGAGMTESTFGQYHDFAAGLKVRGTGIGFAGVGAKISFNMASRVVTETSSDSFKGGSNWYLQSKKKLIWEDIEPVHLEGRGTRVMVEFRTDEPLPYDSTDDLLSILRQHYMPLLDGTFLELYDTLRIYSKNLRFVINGTRIEPGDIVTTYALQNVKRFFPKKASKRVGYGILGVASVEYPLGGNISGVLLCTHGKIVKADWFNQFPAEIGPRVIGLVEIPEFVHFLTSSKTDFFHRGHRHREFEAFYGPVREEFKDWLNELGVKSIEVSSGDDAAKLEKEIRKLIDDLPELGDFFGFRGPKKILAPNPEGPTPAELQEGVELTFPIGEGESAGAKGLLDVGDGAGETLVETDNGKKPATPISRTGKSGPKITFAEAPERQDLSWVDGNNIVINNGHPAYKKVMANAAVKRLHCLFAIAIAVQKFMVGSQAPEISFTDKMMTAWGKK